MPNRLATESSPYLLQHSENPVDWYPWGPEALERSRAEDRPILLSVGYSSCHWCHVMERESFEDPAIAALMNRLYVNIKVDREERPDIDQIYMKAVQAMTGRGGWPMTVILTPEGVPFFGGTYYPPEPQPGMPSFPQVLEAVADAWQNRRDDVASGSARLLKALRATGAVEAASTADADTLSEAARVLGNRFDATWGGFGRAPKFPQPVTLDFLMTEHTRTGKTKLLEMAVHTLRRMAQGGMRDHLGGGFHRYSVDERWLVPHFEKMLYDNALMARAYIDAWRLTDSDDLRDVAESTLDYVLRDLTDPSGAFYSARDADSEGEEGTFYVWTPAQVESALGADVAELFCAAFDITERGNFEGRSIPHLPRDLSIVAEEAGLSLTVVETRLALARSKLVRERGKREAPFRDEKVLTSWNGMMVRAFAEAGAAFGRRDYLTAAAKSAGFLWDHHRVDGRLLHTSMDGVAKQYAFLDDHAALGNACLSLYEATLDPMWYERSLWLAEEILERFWDEAEATVFDTPHDGESLIIRPRDPMDNATPSGPSLAAELLQRLGHLTSEGRFTDRARAIVQRESDALGQYSPAFGRMLVVLERLVAPPLEIAVSGRDVEEVAALLREAHRVAHPSKIIGGWLGSVAPPPLPLFQGRTAPEGRATAWVCSGYACRLPVHDAAALRLEVVDTAT